MSSQYFPNSSVEKTSEYHHHHTIPDENISLLYPLLSKWNLLPSSTWNIPPQLPTIFLSKSETVYFSPQPGSQRNTFFNWLLSSSKARTPQSQPIHYSDKRSKAKVACKMPYKIKIRSLSITRLPQEPTERVRTTKSDLPGFLSLSSYTSLQGLYQYHFSTGKSFLNLWVCKRHTSVHTHF